MSDKTFALNADVAKKYDIVPNFLSGNKLLFPFQNKHGVKPKPAHLLTLAEVDALYAANAVKGVFTLKAAPATPAAEAKSDKK